MPVIRCRATVSLESPWSNGDPIFVNRKKMGKRVIWSRSNCWRSWSKHRTPWLRLVGIWSSNSASGNSTCSNSNLSWFLHSQITLSLRRNIQGFWIWISLYFFNYCDSTFRVLFFSAIYNALTAPQASLLILFRLLSFSVDSTPRGFVFLLIFIVWENWNWNCAFEHIYMEEIGMKEGVFAWMDLLQHMQRWVFLLIDAYLFFVVFASEIVCYWGY